MRGLRGVTDALGSIWVGMKEAFGWLWRVLVQANALGWQVLKEAGAYWRGITSSLLAIVTALVAVAVAAVAVILDRSTSEDISRLSEWFVLAEPFAPYATAVVALLAGLVAVAGVIQRHAADRRAEWWRRVQYGIDLVRDVDKVGRNAGLELLTSLLDDRRWQRIDVRTLQDVVNVLTDEVIDELSAAQEAERLEETRREQESHEARLSPVRKLWSKLVTRHRRRRLRWQSSAR